MVRRFKWVFLAGLLALMTACLVLSWITRDAMVHLPFLGKNQDRLSASGGQSTIVNLQPWKNLLEVQQRAATTNFNIVGVRAQAEQLDGILASLW